MSRPARLTEGRMLLQNPGQASGCRPGWCRSCSGIELHGIRAAHIFSTCRGSGGCLEWYYPLLKPLSKSCSVSHMENVQHGLWKTDECQTLGFGKLQSPCADTESVLVPPRECLHQDKRWKNGREPSSYCQINTTEQEQIPGSSELLLMHCPGQSVPLGPPSSPAVALP